MTLATSARQIFTKRDLDSCKVQVDPVGEPCQWLFPVWTSVSGRPLRQRQVGGNPAPDDTAVRVTSPTIPFVYR